jgi:hypothetical protein
MTVSGSLRHLDRCNVPRRCMVTLVWWELGVPSAHGRHPMPRNPRLFVPRATYHVCCRVARGEYVFDSDEEAIGWVPMGATDTLVEVAGWGRRAPGFGCGPGPRPSWGMAGYRRIDRRALMRTSMNLRPTGRPCSNSTRMSRSLRGSSSPLETDPKTESLRIPCRLQRATRPPSSNSRFTALLIPQSYRTRDATFTVRGGDELSGALRGLEAHATISPHGAVGILPAVVPPLRRRWSLRGLEAHATISPHGAVGILPAVVPPPRRRSTLRGLEAHATIASYGAAPGRAGVGPLSPPYT